MRAGGEGGRGADAAGGVERALLRAFLDALAPANVPARFRLDSDDLGERRALAARPLACLRWLAGLDAAPEAQTLVRLLREHAAALPWGQTYRAADFGGRFLENYGWLEVFGARGCFRHDGLAGGVLLLGPDTLYPDHHHTAEEIYVPLTGPSLWRMGDGPFARRAAGEVIHHASDVPHAMRTGAAPLLALYLWRGGPLDQRSAITGAAGSL